MRAAFIRVASALALTACSFVHEPNVDVGMADAGSDADAASAPREDGGAPPQYCPDTLVRRTLAVEGGAAGTQAVEIVSTAGFEVVAATVGDTGTSGRLGDYWVWSVERISGATVELAHRVAGDGDGDVWIPVDAIADAQGASILSCTVDRSRCARQRWVEGAASLEEESLDISVPTDVRFARRDEHVDTLMRVESPAGAVGVDLSFWDWPAHGPVSRRVVTSELLSDVVLGPYFQWSSPVSIGSGLVVALHADDPTDDARVVWMDPSATRVEAVTRVEVSSLEAGTRALQPMADGVVALAGVRDERNGEPQVFRVTRTQADGAPVTIPFFDVQSGAGGADGAYFAGIEDGPAHGGDGPQQRFLFFSHVADVPFRAEGGGRPWVSGGCSRNGLDLVVPPVGGVVVASSCGVTNHGVSLIYACVPGVL